MTSWYQAVCDAHKECCKIFIIHQGANRIAWAHDGSPNTTKDHEIPQSFLSDHWTCELRLLRDDVGSIPSNYVDRTPP